MNIPNSIEQAGLAEDPCDCAPTADERRAFWSPKLFSRRSALGVGALSVAALATFGVSRGVSAAYAATYPSWDDVQRAKNNEAAKAGEVTRIQGLIAALEQQVAETKAAAEIASQEFYEAQQAFFTATTRADDLQEQADAQTKTADDAANNAGQVASQLYRNGPRDDTSLDLFFSGSSQNADDLLARLGTMDKLLASNQAIYDAAVEARNTAKALSEQAEVARVERDRLQQVAEEKMNAAKAAAEAAEAALNEQTAQLATLNAQLAALQDTTAKTIADYQEGVRVAEEARKKREAEEAARRAEEARRAAAAAAAASAARPSGGGGGGGGGGGNGGGAPNSSGWVRPHGGARSSGYGPRASQCGPQGCSSSWHFGVDLANGCGTAIFAAYPGTVDSAFYNGGYGNYIRIQHGGGLATGYAHIRPGGFAVRQGQWVSAGQVIAYAGNTGGSFGCHLHFEVYINGRVTNPIAFMASKGISV